MTDQEIVCAFMEPKPPMPEGDVFDRAFMGEMLGEWWCLATTGYDAGDEPVIVPRTITLSGCHEVEARLSGEQWRNYIDTVVPVRGNIYEECKALIHADAPTKITALAAVLRQDARDE